MSLGSLILWCTNWSQFTFVTSTVTWAWADREAARAKMATKATQTRFRGIRSSSQEIAIFAHRSVVPNSMNRLEAASRTTVEQGELVSWPAVAHDLQPCVDCGAAQPVRREVQTLTGGV